MEPLDIEELMRRPSASGEPPARALAPLAIVIGDTVDDALREHLRVHHASQRHIEAGGWLQRLYRAIGMVIEDVIERHEHRHHGGPTPTREWTHFHKPTHDRAVGVILADWEHRFEERGVHAGATLWADPDQRADKQTDLVLAAVDGKNLVCQLNEVPVEANIIGPIVWVETSFPPRASPSPASKSKP